MGVLERAVDVAILYLGIVRRLYLEVRHSLARSHQVVFRETHSDHVRSGWAKLNQVHKDHTLCKWFTFIGTVELGYIIHGIYHPAAYIDHCRPEPNFYIIKPSGYIIQPSGYIGHFERCEREHLRA